MSDAAPGSAGAHPELEACLSGERLAPALISGIHRVLSAEEELNRINVFPVPDGDTGTNLSLTLGALLAVLRSPAPHAGTLLATVADALLDAARGNSGAILAQFFQGMSDFAADASCLSPADLAGAVSRGRAYAFQAISEPREGTVLSTIAAFTDGVERSAMEPAADIAMLVRRGALRAEAALAATTFQLDVLRKAGVVDAGAKGFVLLVDGMAEYLTTGRCSDAPAPAPAGGKTPIVTSAGRDSDFRWCTECMVSGDDIDHRKLREALTGFGDSLVVAGTRTKARIHIHSDAPARVFDVARRFGRVAGEKADDTERQVSSNRRGSRHFAVITDSAADIPEAEIERLDIHIVPCRIQIGHQAFLDKVTITSREFFEKLKACPDHPTTSQPAPGDFRRQFQFLASHYPDVLSINLTGSVSGTLEAARSAAGRVEARGRIRIIDSMNASLGQGLLVTYAAECASTGMQADETVAALRCLIPRTRCYGLLFDLDYAVRGGRVSRYVRTVANLARLTAMIRSLPDGRIAAGRFLFGRGNLARRFAAHVARRTDASRPLRLAVAHAAAPEAAEVLREELLLRLPNVASSFITDTGAALGVHGGPGTLIVATQPVWSPDLCRESVLPGSA